MSNRDPYARRHKSRGLTGGARSLRDWRNRALLRFDWRSRLPDFLIIGAAKAGTTSLHDYLAGQPGFVPSHRKEVRYFSDPARTNDRWYASHFPRRRPGTLHFESSPMYLHSLDAPRRVAQLLPGRRFIVLLRDPARRAISNYWHIRTHYDEPRSAVEAIGEQLDDEAAMRGANLARAHVRAGLYAEHLERWFEHVPREQFSIGASEALWAEDTEGPADIVRWLGRESVAGPPMQQLRAKTREEAPAELLERLQDYYRKPNERLVQLLGWRPPWA